MEWMAFEGGEAAFESVAPELAHSKISSYKAYHKVAKLLNKIQNLVVAEPDSNIHVVAMVDAGRQTPDIPAGVEDRVELLAYSTMESGDAVWNPSGIKIMNIPFAMVLVTLLNLAATKYTAPKYKRVGGSVSVVLPQLSGSGTDVVVRRIFEGLSDSESPPQINPLREGSGPARWIIWLTDGPSTWRLCRRIRAKCWGQAVGTVEQFPYNLHSDIAELSQILGVTTPQDEYERELVEIRLERLLKRSNDRLQFEVAMSKADGKDFYNSPDAEMPDDDIADGDDTKLEPEEEDEEGVWGVGASVDAPEFLYSPWNEETHGDGVWGGGIAMDAPEFVYSPWNEATHGDGVWGVVGAKASPIPVVNQSEVSPPLRNINDMATAARHTWSASTYIDENGDVCIRADVPEGLGHHKPEGSGATRVQDVSSAKLAMFAAIEQQEAEAYAKEKAKRYQRRLEKGMKRAVTFGNVTIA
jgi:hypothetical protein